MKQLNYAHAMQFLLMDEPIGAKEAVRIGLVNESVPHDQLMTRAEEIANKIASLPPVAVRFLKEFLIRGQDLSQDQAWHLQWVYNHLASTHSSDALEGAQSFLEKRQRNVGGGIRS
jgi:enoyl-CoA hydratase/carnithine racemase